MIRLLSELRNYKKEVVLAPLFKMLEALFELFVPLVMKLIVDEAIPDRDTAMIVWMCLLLFLLALVGLGCSLTAQYFSAKAATGFASGIRTRVFSHIQALTFTDLDRIGASTLITRMTSDINQIQNGTNLTLRLFMRSPFVVFGAMIMAFTIDVQAAWVFAVVIPLLSLVVFGIMLYTLPLYRKVQGSLDRVTGKTRENLTGVRVIRAFRREEREVSAFREANGTLEREQLFVGKVAALMNPVTYVLVNLAIVFLIYTGAVRVQAGALTQGAVIALVNYMGQILVELIKLANLIINMTKAAACGNRVQELLESGTEEQALSGTVPREETEDAIRFDRVSMRYEGAGADALTDVSFSVKRGETVGIIGGTGSGKTSLVHLIPGYYPVKAGTLSVFGQDTRDWDPSELRRRVAVVMQKAVLFAGTVRSNLLMGNPDADDETLWKALEDAQAASFVREKDGLDTAVEQDGRNFSGGQKQRLAIARALTGRPGILILDDSASALDFATDAALREAISRLDPGMTVLIVSQRTASVMNADRILVLDDGKLAGSGTHRELLETCGLYREIYDSQFQ